MFIFLKYTVLINLFFCRFLYLEFLKFSKYVLSAM